MKALRQIVVSLLLLAAGVYAWALYVPASHPFLARVGVLDLMGIEMAQSAGADQARRFAGGGPARVIAEPVSERALADRISAIGDGRALRSVTVRSNAVGVITELSLAAGSYVESGTVIVKLQDEEEQIALEQARIQLDDAEREVERLQQLQAAGAATQVRLRETELTLRSAELAVRQAEFDLSQRQIAAPISGWVGIIDLEEGDRVNAQDVLVTITDRSEILIDFRVPERIVSKISVGQKFQVVPLGLTDTTLTGEVSAVDSVVDRASRTLLLQGRVANETDLLRAGMAFSVNLTFAGPTMLSIPPLAVQWSSDGPFVWVVRDGTVASEEVVITQRDSDEVLVTSQGLKAGEMVVTEGVQALRPGAEVEMVAQKESASADRGARTGASL